MSTDTDTTRVSYRYYFDNGSTSVSLDTDEEARAFAARGGHWNSTTRLCFWHEGDDIRYNWVESSRWEELPDSATAAVKKNFRIYWLGWLRCRCYQSH